MLRRMLMVLLLVGLAFPAIAAALIHDHAGDNHTWVSSMHEEHGAPAAPSHGAVKTKHECIGCIASYNYDGLTEPPVPLHAPLATMPVRTLPSTRAGPDTPPPKS